MINRLLESLNPEAASEETPFEDLSPEEQAEVLAEEKKAKIDWHARNVRTGPARFTTVTPGRHASKVRRSQRAAERKMNLKHRRRWVKSQFPRAILRGHLQAVGALPYATDYVAPLSQRIKSGQWIVGAFGERYEEDVSRPDGFHEAGELILSDDLLPNAVQAAVSAHHGRTKVSA